MSDSLQALVGALQATIRALEMGDIEAAAAAVVTMNEACAEAARAGTAVRPELLSQARALHGRCEALADKTQAAVVAAVLQSSTQRKASDAYGSEK